MPCKGEEDLAAMRNLVAAVIRFEHPAEDQDLLRLIDLLNDCCCGALAPCRTTC